jgi:hypothetical protein
VVNNGAVLEGEDNITTCGLQPGTVEVIVTFVPTGMPVIAVAVTVPVEATIVALLGLLIFTS